ncbi:MAG: ribonuclease HII [Bdellovibrionales bacterium]|nr:ribonuclease HII [Bdellovibrionales bacterium]
MILIAGVDEAGRGPLAGPVVAAAVVLPTGYYNSEIKDSKQLSAKKRDLLFEVIRSVSASWAIVAVGAKRIDDLNILQATRLAMALAVKRVHADHVLIDGNTAIDIDLPQQTVIQGDCKHIEIAAASILAKVWRDNLMRTLDERYPGYGFSQHAGYPTTAHKAAIARLGPSPVHRCTFRGVKEYVRTTEPLEAYQEPCFRAEFVSS